MGRTNHLTCPHCGGGISLGSRLFESKTLPTVLPCPHCGRSMEIDEVIRAMLGATAPVQGGHPGQTPGPPDRRPFTPSRQPFGEAAEAALRGDLIRLKRLFRRDPGAGFRDSAGNTILMHLLYHRCELKV